MKRHLGIKFGIDETFMLMTPDDQVQEVREEVFGKVTRFGVCMTLQKSGGVSCPKDAEHSLILMYGYQVEPVTLLGVRSEELDLAISEGSKKSLVSDVAQAVQGKFGMTFLQQHWLD